MYTEPVQACDHCRNCPCPRYERMLFEFTQQGIFDLLPDRIAEDCDTFSAK